MRSHNFEEILFIRYQMKKKVRSAYLFRIFQNNIFRCLDNRRALPLTEMHLVKNEI